MLQFPAPSGEPEGLDWTGFGQIAEAAEDFRVKAAILAANLVSNLDDGCFACYTYITWVTGGDHEAEHHAKP
jgi:hypothetical protein